MGTRGKLPKNKLPVATAVLMPDKDHEAQKRRWRVESALETLTRAEEHKADKNLMKDVRMLAKEKKSKMEKFC